MMFVPQACAASDVKFFIPSYARKTVHIRPLDDVISSINGWYMERGLFGLMYFEIIMFQGLSFIVGEF
ncbi:hypothetical protein Hanom_Chr08g00730001 [Helianthus anomalus]